MVTNCFNAVMSRGGSEQPTRSRARSSRRKEVRKLERSLSSTAALNKLKLPCPSFSRGLSRISPGKMVHNQPELCYQSRDSAVSHYFYVVMLFQFLSSLFIVLVKVKFQIKVMFSEYFVCF